MITASLILASLQRRRKNTHSPSKALGKAVPTDVTQMSLRTHRGQSFLVWPITNMALVCPCVVLSFRYGDVPLCFRVACHHLLPHPPSLLLPHGEGCLQHRPCLSVAKSQMHSCVRNLGSQENTGHHSSGSQTWPPMTITETFEKTHRSPASLLDIGIAHAKLWSWGVRILETSR